MTAYMCCVYQGEVTVENSRVEESEDLGQDFGWKSVHGSNGVDGEPQLNIYAGELVCRAAVIEWIGTEIMGGNLLTVDSCLVPNAERCCTLLRSKVTSWSTDNSSPDIATTATRGLVWYNSHAWTEID